MKYHLKNKWNRYIPQKHNSDLVGQVQSVDTVERLVDTEIEIPPVKFEFPGYRDLI